MLIISLCTCALLVATATTSSAQNISLIGGRVYNEGVVFVFRSGQWQTVCDDGWDLNEANVACRQLGYGNAIKVVTNALFGRGTGGQWKAYFSCTGSESRLEYCSTSSSSCSHSEDVGVICSTTSLQQGSLRLAGSSRYFYAGRLEIYVNGQWGTVCDDGWGNNEANVACKQMGFEGAYHSDWTLRSSGSSSQRIWLDDVTCTGSESQLINCNHRGLGVENCGHSEDIGIRCTRSVTRSAQEIRLIGGNADHEGRVEVLHSGQWQTVCDYGWDLNDADVACRQLGYGYAIRAVTHSQFGRGTGGQRVVNILCIGSERRLQDCVNSTLFSILLRLSCSHSRDAGVICSTSSLQQGSLRLASTRSLLSSYPYAGRLEIYAKREWGTVCDDFWGNNEANVACRQMGFRGAYDSNWTVRSSGSIYQSIWLDDITCTGSESQLINCNHRGLGVENCVHSEDIGIGCTILGSTLPTESVTISTSSSPTTASMTGIIVGVVLAAVFLCGLPCIIICIIVVCCAHRRKRARRTTRAPVTTTAGNTVAVAMVYQQPQQQVVYQPQPNYQQQQGGYPPQPDYQQQQGGYPPPPDYHQQQGGYPPQPDYQQQQGEYPPKPDYHQQVDYSGQQPAPVPHYPQPINLSN